MPVLSRDDLDFLLFDWLKLEGMSGVDRFAGQDRSDWSAVLDLAEKLAEREFLSSYKPSDRDEPRLENGRVVVQKDVATAVRAFLDAGLHLATVDADHGGMQLPMAVATGAMAQIMAANISASGFPMLSIANARVITDFGTPAQIAAFAAPQHEGRALGTMCLSEPDTGSSLGDISTRAAYEGEDDLGPRYRVRGRKMWISVGGQDVTDNTVHLVLAKAEDGEGHLTPGSKGNSLFIVPAVLPDGVANDVVVAGLNHKMGYRGTPNTMLNFGEAGEGAIGWRIGAEGDGMRIMFQMMNEARVNVGLGGAALAYRGYLLSRQYAAERRQGRLPGEKTGSQVTIDRHPDVRRMILSQKAIAEGALALCLYSARLVDVAAHGAGEDRAHAQRLLDILTPVTKSWPSEMGLAANAQAIQIHGGYGYTRDFDVEQLYRDNRLNPIHEGTTGIQGLDLLGRKVLFDGLVSFDALLAEIRGTIAAARDIADLTGFADRLAAQADRIDTLVRARAGSGDAGAVLAHATGFLSAFGHFVLGWLWLDVGRVAVGRDDPVSRGKMAALRYFYGWEMPLIDGWLAPLEAEDGLLAEVDPADL